MTHSSDGRYSATLTGGALMPVESRRVAALMLTNPSPDAWRQAIHVDNLLQKNSPATAKRQAGLIRDRLEALPPEAWVLVAQAPLEVQLQTLLVGAVRHSALLADYLRGTVARHLARMDLSLPPQAWDAFIADCIARDPIVASWSPATLDKLRQIVGRVLLEARIVDGTPARRLRRPDLHPDVRELLRLIGDPTLTATLELSA